MNVVVLNKPLISILQKQINNITLFIHKKKPHKVL